MKNISAFKLSLVASGAMIALSTAAIAAEADGSSEASIVVTGQRQQYRGDVSNKELPQSIQVIDSEILQTLNVTRLDSALELASGVARQNNFGGLWDAYAIRGFAGDENFPSGFLVNGFNGGRGYGGPRDASNVESIEVLKGPTSALFGRGEPGGTVNIITKKANLAESKGSVAFSGGSWNTYRAEGDYNYVISDDVAVRLNGAYQDAKSFRDTIDSTKFTASPSLLVRIDSNTSFTYEAEYVDQEVDFDRGIIAVDGDLGVLPLSRFLGEPLDGPTKVEVLGHQAQLQHDFAKNWSALIGFGYRDTSFGGYSSDAEISPSRQTIDDSDANWEAGNLVRQRRFRNYDTEHMVVRGEISGKFDTFGLTHHLLVGADWDKFEIVSFQKRRRPATPINIYDPVYGVNLVEPATVITQQTEIQKAWGIYLQDQIDLTDMFKLRFGGRYDDFRRSVNTGPDVATQIHDSSHYTRFSPTTGLVFEASDAVSFYASWGKGFRPNSGADFFGELFKPETSEGYEVGTKYELLDGDVSGTLSLFSMKKNNILTADPVNAGYSMTLGKARSKGLEFDMNAKLPYDLSLVLTYAYTDAEIAKDIGDPNFGNPIPEGSPLLNVPKHSGNALLSKDFELSDERKATVGAGVNFASKRLGETATSFYLPSYTLVKIFASYELIKNVRISADVNNLFDKRWYASSYSKYWVAPGTPRSFTIRAAYSF